MEQTMKNLNSKSLEQTGKILTVEDLVLDQNKVKAREILRETAKLPRTGGYSSSRLNRSSYRVKR
jgi:hypothetical protein